MRSVRGRRVRSVKGKESEISKEDSEKELTLSHDLYGDALLQFRDPFLVPLHGLLFVTWKHKSNAAWGQHWGNKHEHFIIF